MEGNYAVTFGKQACGKVQVLRQGLYYRFICRCRIRGDTLFRLRVSCGGRQEELGVLAPVDGGFGLDRKLPVKNFKEGTPEFRLYTKVEEREGKFVPILPEEPFSYISRLQNAFLQSKNGQIGISIGEP